MDVTRLNDMGWRAPTSFEVGLTKAYLDFTHIYSR